MCSTPSARSSIRHAKFDVAGQLSTGFGLFNSMHPLGAATFTWECTVIGPIPTFPIAVFSTTREKNGTAYIRDVLARERPETFCAIRTYGEFARWAWKRREQEPVVFALSDSHYLYAAAVLRRVAPRARLVLAVFHPDQWSVSGDARVSRTRAEVMRRVIGEMTMDEIIFGTWLEYEACRGRLSPGDPKFILGPVAPDPPPRYAPAHLGPGTPLRIVTVGRLVPFKTQSILSMVGAVERMRDRGIDARYTIIGEGPDDAAIRQRTASSRHASAFAVPGPCESDAFATAIAGHDVFFGMGLAAIRAALLGMPTLLARFRDDSPASNGFMSTYPDVHDPVLGGTELGAPGIPLDATLADLDRMDAATLRFLGASDEKMGERYTIAAIGPRLTRDLTAAPRAMPKVTLREIATMRIETWVSRLRGRRAIDA